MTSLLSFIFIILAVLGLSMLSIALIWRLELKTKWRIIFGVLCLLVFIGVGSFSFLKSDNNQGIISLEIAFLGDRTLNCEGFLVNKTNFDLNSKTYTLVGKKDAPTHNIMISLEKCHIVEQSEIEHYDDLLIQRD